MPGVVRAITRLQDADDFTGSLTNTYIPVYSTAQSKFVMTAQPTTSPGGSSTHVQYNNGGAFAGDSGFTYNGSGTATLSTALVVPVVRPSADSTTAVKITKADGTTAVVTVDTTNSIQYVNGAINSGNTLNTSSGSTVAGELRSYQIATTPIYVSIKTSGSKSGIFRSNTDFFVYYDTSTGNTVLDATFGGASILLRTQGNTAVTITSTKLVGIGVTPTAWLHLPASTTSYASLCIPSGTAPTSPNDGDVWSDGTNFKCRIGGVTKTFTVT